MDKGSTTRRAVLLGMAFLACAPEARAQVRAGGEFRINSYTTNRQFAVRPAMEPDGDFVAVWQSQMQDGDDYGVYARRYAASGLPRGGEFRVNVHTTGYQMDPAVAVGSAGDFIVVWRSAQDGSSASVHGRRYDAAGNAVGGEFQVNTYTPGFQYRPRVGRAADGAFVVAWTSFGGDGGGYGVAARRFDASGNPVGSELVVNTYTTGDQFAVDVAVAASGEFVAVWEDYNPGRDGSGSAVFGQRFDASGVAQGAEFRVNTYTTLRQGLPSVSISPAGGFVVAWTSQAGDGGGSAVFARRFDATGSALGNDFLVNTYTTGNQGSTIFSGGQVAHDARGNFVVTWPSSAGQDGSLDAAIAQRYTASGARRGAEFLVNTYTTGAQTPPSVASDALGNFVVAWVSRTDQDGDNWGSFGQRFGGLSPTALAVDPAGNQVVEPGETAEVGPAWRNRNGAAQAFGGTLFGITGPPGAAYVVVDDTADYGTVADGAIERCVDCYAVSVSDPPARPSLHWDASAVESITPDAHGQQARWLIHVGRSFDDVPTSSPFYRFIETLLHHDVTGGCSATGYCPSGATTREAMSAFVLVAKEGAGYLPPACTAPMFGDVPAASPFCRWVEELARRGVVAGCGGGNYCPTHAVSREQMAVFVLRTLHPTLQPPACTTPMYNDVPASSGFCRWIEELTRRSVVSGCGGGNYCPAGNVTREQMGVFIGVTFDLTLYGPDR